MEKCEVFLALGWVGAPAMALLIIANVDYEARFELRSANMLLSKPEDLGSALVGILQAGSTTLFAGAGVSARAGLPVWSSYLELLAQVVEPKEHLIAELIRKRISEGSYLLAAHYYKTSTEIPKGERYAKLAEPFRSGKYDPRPLQALTALPFASVVTTNYDRALHDAYAATHGKSPLHVELDDSTLDSAFFNREFFIARIHGKAEAPEGMVLDADDYERLYKNNSYNDFLHSLFTQRQCVFIGFSFDDPAISRILQFISERGISAHKKHYAFVPKDGGRLIERMSAQNVEVLRYDDRNGHEVVWNGFNHALATLQASVSVSPQLPSTFATAKRLLAVCFARAAAGDDSPLRTIVVQGILISEIDSGTTRVEDLPRRLQQYMSLSNDEAIGLTSSALDSLVQKKLCLVDGDDVVAVDKMADFFSVSPAPKLAKAIIDRLMVRDQYDVKPDIRSALERIIEEVLVQRGFDLGAEFAGAKLSSDLDPSATILKAIERHLPNHRQDRKSQIAAAFVDLIRRPTTGEEALLAEVGRISIGIEMVLQAGRATMYQTSLPDMVYLDASVVLPAIAPGHPYQRAYVQALSRLQDALDTEGKTATVFIADVFLNEIVTHRKNAIAIVADFGLEDRDVLRKRIQYYGADNVNVFVGAYSSWIAERHSGGFGDFLASEAPYETEDQLAEFLKAKGIRVASTRARTPSDIQAYERMKDRLLDGYDRAEVGYEDADRKALILKKHEASQVVLLVNAIREGRRAVLVTADKQLRRVTTGLGIRELRDALISHRNLVQLVDLLVGVPFEPSSLARLLWTVRIADDSASIRDYLITRALPQYDAALSLKMGDLLDRIVDRVVREAKLENVRFGSASTVARAREVKFLDRIEGEVFADLAQEVKKLREELRERKRP